MKLVPNPCNYVADGLEANNFLLVKANSKHPDVHSLIPKEQLDNPDALYPQRTEKRVTYSLPSLVNILTHCTLHV